MYMKYPMGFRIDSFLNYCTSKTFSILYLVPNVIQIDAIAAGASVKSFCPVCHSHNMRILLEILIHVVYLVYQIIKIQSKNNNHVSILFTVYTFLT